MSADWRADLPSHGGRSEQNRSPAAQQEAGGHREDDQEDAQNTGEHEVGIYQLHIQYVENVIK